MYWRETQSGPRACHLVHTEGGTTRRHLVEGTFMLDATISPIPPIIPDPLEPPVPPPNVPKEPDIEPEPTLDPPPTIPPVKRPPDQRASHHLPGGA
jgi:hypothetical protein